MRSGTAASPVTFTAAPGANVTVTGKKYGFYVSNQSYVTIQGFKVTGTTSDGFHLSSNSSNLKVIGNDVSFAGQPTSGKTAKGIYVANVIEFGNQLQPRPSTTSNFGIYLDGSTAPAGPEQPDVGKRAGLPARCEPASACTARPRTRSPSNVSHDNEDSGSSCTRVQQQPRVNNVSYGNGDHGIDNYQLDRKRIIANSVYKNVTAGINAEGGSTGATIANNISVDNGIKSPRTRSDIRVDSSVDLGHDDGLRPGLPDARRTSLLIWNSSTTRPSRRSAATGRRRTASRPIRSG